MAMATLIVALKQKEREQARARWEGVGREKARDSGAAGGEPPAGGRPWGAETDAPWWVPAPHGTRLEAALLSLSSLPRKP